MIVLGRGEPPRPHDPVVLVRFECVLAGERVIEAVVDSVSIGAIGVARGS